MRSSNLEILNFLEIIFEFIFCNYQGITKNFLLLEHFVVINKSKGCKNDLNEGKMIKVIKIISDNNKFFGNNIQFKV